MDGLEVMEGSLWFGIHQGMLPKSNLGLTLFLLAANAGSVHVRTKGVYAESQTGFVDRPASA